MEDLEAEDYFEGEDDPYKTLKTKTILKMKTTMEMKSILKTKIALKMKMIYTRQP